MKRWTIKELKNLSDREFLQQLINERRESLTNPYAPLSERLNATEKRLRTQEHLTAPQKDSY